MTGELEPSRRVLRRSLRDFFRVGGVSVQLLADRNDDVKLVSSLEPFRFEVALLTFKIQIEWVQSLPGVSGFRFLIEDPSGGRMRRDGFRFDFGFSAMGGEPLQETTGRPAL